MSPSADLLMPPVTRLDSEKIQNMVVDQLQGQNPVLVIQKPYLVQSDGPQHYQYDGQKSAALR